MTIKFINSKDWKQFFRLCNHNHSFNIAQCCRKYIANWVSRVILVGTSVTCVNLISLDFLTVGKTFHFHKVWKYSHGDDHMVHNVTCPVVQCTQCHHWHRTLPDTDSGHYQTLSRGTCLSHRLHLLTIPEWRSPGHLDLSW